MQKVILVVDKSAERHSQRRIHQSTECFQWNMVNPEATKSYAYNFDQIGNRTTANLAGTSWSYASNNLNQYTALTKSGTTSNPTYDADGNLLTYDGWTYTWNLENRLIKATKGPLMLSFQYDYMGRRIEKRVLNDAQLVKNLKYVYDGYKLVAEVNGMNNNTQLRRYTWNAPATGLDTPLAMYNVANNTTYYYRTGANKNVIALTNGTRVVGHYEYSPFGITIKQTGDMAATNPFRFSSEYHDDETGLIYYNYRYYNPTLGRWLSKDPIGENGGENLYGFVGNNSANIIDRLGLAWWELIPVAGLIGHLIADPEGYNVYDYSGYVTKKDCCKNQEKAIDDCEKSIKSQFISYLSRYIGANTASATSQIIISSAILKKVATSAGAKAATMLGTPLILIDFIDLGVQLLKINKMADAAKEAMRIKCKCPNQ